MAIVGAGLMGRWHAHAVRLLGAEVVAIVDHDRARAGSLARSSGGAAVHSEFGNALGQERPEVVHVCTPMSTHFEIAKQAMDAGADVLIEKPLASGAEEAARLHAHASERGRLVCPVLQWTCQRSVRRAIASQVPLGPLMHAEVVLCSAGADGRPEPERDVVAAEILPHPLSLFERLLPGGLESLSWQGIRPRPGEWRLQTAAGAVAVSLSISLSSRPTEASVALRHERGTIRLDMFHGTCFVEPGRVSRTRKILRPFDVGRRMAFASAANLVARAARREWAYPGLRELVAEFHEAVRTRSEPPISAASSISVARECDRVARAFTPGPR